MGTTPVTPVAVVIGMACRLPGGIDSPERLWEALLRGDDLVTEIPPDRWDGDEYYDPQPGVPGRSVTKWGGFLDDVAGFDSEFFGINEREATAIDPQHRLLLETSWEAMEHAGLTRETMADSLTGVFVGLTHGDYQLLAADAHAVEGPYGFTGSSFSLASGRIAYALGVHGPALTVDTACSSGLTAVHLACHSLIDGESDLALAGGAAVILDPRKFVAGSAEGMLSPTGRCHAFDVAADGFVSSEGCVVVLLKRLPDALRDGNRILAVIRGSAANQDGHTVNIATPSATAQTAVYRAALAAAGVDARSIGMVEAHGPGTPVGDPIEYASLANVYGIEGPCALATVKTNFGHAQSAAGALGLMKTILALQHGVVPQNLHFTRLPDEMARIDTKLFVPQEITPWPTNGHHPRRAAVSSYGLSGTNVHAIVEQAQNRLPKPLHPRTSQPNRRRRHRCCSRCRPPRPTNCTAPPAGWPTGWQHMRTWRCRIWPTPWRVGARTAQSAPPSLRAARRSSPRLCGRSPTAILRIRPRLGRTTGDRCGCSPGRVRSGLRWVLSCWRPNRCSPPPSRRPSH